MEGCPGRGCVPLNQGRHCGSGFEGERPTVARHVEPADGAATEMRSPVPSWRRRHSEVGTVSVAPPAGVLVRETTVRGVGTQGAELHNCGAGVGDVRPRGASYVLTGRS